MMTAAPVASLQNRRVFASWSGGKDCCLALHRAAACGAAPAALLTMMREDPSRSRAHGLHESVLRAQAEAMGLPITLRSTSLKEYAENFVAELNSFREVGLDIGVYGDIDLVPHLEWVLEVSRRASVSACHPLWQEPRRNLIAECFELGIRARIIAVQETKLPADLLGRILDEATVEEIEQLGADACGENGEYHTVVEDAPLFRRPIELEQMERVFRDGYWFLDVCLRGESRK